MSILSQDQLQNPSYYTGSFTGSFTGSMAGTSSLAISSSYALSASYAQTASYVVLAQSASYIATASKAISSSYALTASYAISSSYAENAPLYLPLTGGSITGSLEIQGNVNINGTASVDVFITSYQSSSIIYSSGSTKFGDTLDDFHDFTGSVNITGSGLNLSGGSFSGSGANLYNIPATGITGLNLSQIATGSVTASVSPGSGSFTVVSGSTNLLFISSSGNVGIGTTNPSSKLYIDGNNGYSISSSGDIAINIRNQNSSGESVIGIRNDSGYAAFELFGSTWPVVGLRNSALFTTDANQTGGLSFATLASASIAFRTNSNGISNERLTILANGNVGIGITNPLAKLHVSGSAIISNNLTVTGSITAASFTGSLQGTASYAATASLLLGSVTSASYAATASCLIQEDTINPKIVLKQAISNQEYQIRVGLGTGISSQRFDLYDATVNKTIMTGFTSAGVGKVSIGSSSSFASSVLYVYGGSSGANIDAQANSGSSDTSNIECMSSDYSNGEGIAMRQWGPIGISGSILGYNTIKMGILDFNNDTNIIRTNNTNSLHFGINDVEKMNLHSNGLSLTGSLDVLGEFKLDNATKGAGKILTSDANGNATWATTPSPSLPATQIAFGDGSNLLTGNSGLIFNDGTEFHAEISGIGFRANGDVDMGDYNNTNTGDNFKVSPSGGVAYYDNTSHTGKFGINTVPLVALDVVGDVKTLGYFLAANSAYPDGLIEIQASGNVVIGDGGGDVNGTKITVNDAAQDITLNSTTTTVSNLAGTGTRAVLADADGVLSAPVSDRTVKQNIQPLDYGLNTLLKLKPVSFEYKPDWQRYGSGKQIGFIAQDVQKVLPNSVVTTPQTGKLGINKEDIISVLVKAVQQLTARVQELENK